MKFIVNRDELYKNLSIIAGVISSNNTMAILDNFLFNIEGKCLTLTASDLDTTISATIELDTVDGSGAVAIPSKILLDTLKLSPDGPIIFQIDEDSKEVKFSIAQGKYATPYYPGSEYPSVPVINEPKSFDIDATILQRAISKTIFATGNDELRPNMMGVLCELSADYITFVATDAHKLVRYRNTKIKTDDFASFILPKKPIAQLKAILTGINVPVHVEYSAETHHIRFSFDNIVVFSSLKEGKYPNYEAVIPKENNKTFTINREDFLRSIRRVGIYSSQSTSQVRISLSEDNAHITAEDIDYSNKGEDDVKGIYEGDPMDIGFNSKFLREMIDNMDYDEIRLEMSQPNRAALILPNGDVRPDEDLLMLIMPVMLNY